jgi:hypothetical protein
MLDTSTDVSATAILNDAREYYLASEQLFRAEPRLSRPLNAFYFHIVELAFKAYLRAHGRRRWGHDIHALYDECRLLGFTINQQDAYGLGNVVSLLKSGNEDMGFRYFNLKSVSEPDILWTREVVGQLMRAVEEFVDPGGPFAPGPVAKFHMVIGKPTSR